MVETLLAVSQLRALCNRLGVSRVSRAKNGASMRLEDRYVADPLRLLQAMTETDPRLALSRGSAVALTLKSAAHTDRELLYDLLRVVKALNAKLDELAAEAQAG